MMDGVTVTSAPSSPAKTAAIVLSYNGCEMLKRCLPSTFGENVTAVVDNGSTDGTSDFVAKTWPNVAVVSIPFNVGLGKALNIGARAIAAHNILLMNNDVLVLGDAIVRLTGLLDADPAIGLASPMLLNEDKTIQEFGNDMHVSGLALPPKTVIRPLLDTFFQSGCVTAVRRDQFLGLGGYGEVFEWYYEDVDLAWRFRNAGMRVVVDERARCVHFRGSTLGNGAVVNRRLVSDERHAERTYFSNRNVIFLFARNAPWFQLALQAPFILVRQAVEAAAALRVGDRRLARSYVRAWRDAFAKLAVAMRNVSGSVPSSRRSTLKFVHFQIAEMAGRLRDLFGAGKRA